MDNNTRPTHSTKKTKNGLVTGLLFAQKIPRPCSLLLLIGSEHKLIRQHLPKVLFDESTLDSTVSVLLITTSFLCIGALGLLLNWIQDSLPSLLSLKHGIGPL